MGGRWSLGAAVAVAIGLATAGMVAHADAPKTPGAQAVATRQAHFKDQGRTFKAIIDELKKDQPEKAVIATNAAKLENLASQLPTWFPKGSGPEAGVKTGAKPEVWSDPNGFATVAAGLRTETAKLDQFAQAGDLAALKTQVRAVGGACKACHDKYRVPETH